jgi:hypothetical protein
MAHAASTMKTILALLLACVSISTAQITEKERQFNAEWNRLVDHYEAGHGTIDDHERDLLRLIAKRYPGNQALIAEARRAAQKERLRIWARERQKAMESTRRANIRLQQFEAKQRQQELDRIQEEIRRLRDDMELHRFLNH